MKIRNCYLLLVVPLCSCSPTNWLKMDVIVPAEYSFPDTENISILNASYLPSVMFSETNLMVKMSPTEKQIFDTICTVNLYNGLFSILSDSPNEKLKNAEYYEIRATDTTNFLFPISAKSITFLCDSFDTKYLLSMEYYEFNIEQSEYGYIEDGDWAGWGKILMVNYQIVWRIYSNTGEVQSQFIDKDSLFWDSNNDLYSIPLPEHTDAIREAFFTAGEKYGKRISPSWKEISRLYFQFFSLGEDISLDKNRLLIIKAGKKRNQAFKACYNLAVISESEDKLPEAIQWLEEAKTFKEPDIVNLYIKKLQDRLETREVLDQQSGYN
jgi:hypothetical protein